MPEEPTQEPRTVVVEGPTTGFRTEVQVAGHHFTVDEPVPVGGSDAGPSPYEMLLAALGSCTAMTLRLYADRRQWPLKRAVVKLRHHKVHAQDCVDCENKAAKIDVIDQTEAQLGRPDATRPLCCRTWNTCHKRKSGAQLGKSQAHNRSFHARTECA